MSLTGAAPRKEDRKVKIEEAVEHLNSDLVSQICLTNKKTREAVRTLLEGYEAVNERVSLLVSEIALIENDTRENIWNRYFGESGPEPGKEYARETD